MAPSPQGLGLFHQLVSSDPSLSLHQRQFCLSIFCISLLSAFVQPSLRLLVAEAFIGRGRMEALSFWPHSPSSSPLPLPFPLFIFSLSHYCWSQQSANTQLMDSLSLPPPPTKRPHFLLIPFFLHLSFSLPLSMLLPSSNLTLYMIRWRKDGEKWRWPVRRNSLILPPLSSMSSLHRSNPMSFNHIYVLLTLFTRRRFAECACFSANSFWPLEGFTAPWTLNLNKSHGNCHF